MKKVSQCKDSIMPEKKSADEAFPVRVSCFFHKAITNNAAAANSARRPAIQKGDTLSLPYNAAVPKMIAAMFIAMSPCACLVIKKPAR